ILMAWVLTLPAAIILSGVLYWLSLKPKASYSRSPIIGSSYYFIY
ncbi:hypothetical protein ACTXQV_77145, partial [Klebsiella pneumoniae]